MEDIPVALIWTAVALWLIALAAALSAKSGKRRKDAAGDGGAYIYGAGADSDCGGDGGGDGGGCGGD